MRNVAQIMNDLQIGRDREERERQGARQQVLMQMYQYAKAEEDRNEQRAFAEQQFQRSRRLGLQDRDEERRYREERSEADRIQRMNDDKYMMQHRTTHNLNNPDWDGRVHQRADGSMYFMKDNRAVNVSDRGSRRFVYTEDGTAIDVNLITPAGRGGSGGSRDTEQDWWDRHTRINEGGEMFGNIFDETNNSVRQVQLEQFEHPELGVFFMNTETGNIITRRQLRPFRDSGDVSEFNNRSDFLTRADIGNLVEVDKVTGKFYVSFGSARGESGEISHRRRMEVTLDNNDVFRLDNDSPASRSMALTGEERQGAIPRAPLSPVSIESARILRSMTRKFTKTELEELKKIEGMGKLIEESKVTNIADLFPHLRHLAIQDPQAAREYLYNSPINSIWTERDPTPDEKDMLRREFMRMAL